MCVQALNLTSRPDNSIYVHVTDNCPCLQYDNGSTTITGQNTPCCGNVNHFDLSYFGFQKLAHPNYGLMNLQFRYVQLSQSVLLNPATLHCLIRLHSQYCCCIEFDSKHSCLPCTQPPWTHVQNAAALEGNTALKAVLPTAAKQNTAELVSACDTHCIGVA